MQGVLSCVGVCAAPACGVSQTTRTANATLLGAGLPGWLHSDFDIDSRYPGKMPQSLQRELPQPSAGQGGHAQLRDFEKRPSLRLAQSTLRKNLVHLAADLRSCQRLLWIWQPDIGEQARCPASSGRSETTLIGRYPRDDPKRSQQYAQPCIARADGRRQVPRDRTLDQFQNQQRLAKTEASLGERAA
jgi:hypothetical protein